MAAVVGLCERLLDQTSDACPGTEDQASLSAVCRSVLGFCCRCGRTEPRTLVNEVCPVSILFLVMVVCSLVCVCVLLWFPASILSLMIHFCWRIYPYSHTPGRLGSAFLHVFWDQLVRREGRRNNMFGPQKKTILNRCSGSNIRKPASQGWTGGALP